MLQKCILVEGILVYRYPEESVKLSDIEQMPLVQSMSATSDQRYTLILLHNFILTQLYTVDHIPISA